jgi:hypothetical protein
MSAKLRKYYTGTEKPFIYPNSVILERQFNKSGRIDTWARNRINPGTLCESMKFNDYLRRNDIPLIPDETTTLVRTGISGSKGWK